MNRSTSIVIHESLAYCGQVLGAATFHRHASVCAQLNLEMKQWLLERFLVASERETWDVMCTCSSRRNDSPDIISRHEPMFIGWIHAPCLGKFWCQLRVEDLDMIST